MHITIILYIYAYYTNIIIHVYIPMLYTYTKLYHTYIYNVHELYIHDTYVSLYMYIMFTDIIYTRIIHITKYILSVYNVYTYYINVHAYNTVDPLYTHPRFNPQVTVLMGTHRIHGAGIYMLT